MAPFLGREASKPIRHCFFIQWSVLGITSRLVDVNRVLLKHELLGVS